MKLLIIRHADPDYSADSLTPVGWREAALLSERLERTEITKTYCSLLGRAKVPPPFPCSARAWKPPNWTG